MDPIECQALHMTYPGKPPVDAVRGLDLRVRAGECFGILGPNGAGKTTTIEILEGLLTPTSGHVRVLGRDWGKEPDAIRQRIGISLQETRLLEKLTVRETVALFRAMYRRGCRPDDALARVSLQEKQAARVGKLSGGQRQRLAIACAIVGDPELLFLDEPTTGLDPAARRELWEIIRSFRERGRTVLLTTHYMDEAERLCDRVAIVDRGQIIAEGSPRELIAAVGGEHIVRFVVAAPVPGEAVQQVLRRVIGTQPWREDAGAYEVTVAELHRLLPQLLQQLQQAELTLSSLSTRHATLDDVFMKLAGRHIAAAEVEMSG